MAEYLVLTNVQVQQAPTDQFPKRNSLLTFSFLNKYEGDSTWADLTQTLTLTLPKKIKIRAYETPLGYFSPSSTPVTTQYVQLGNTDGQNSNLSGFTTVPPTFLRGDLIKFNVGYRAQITGQGSREETYMTGAKGLPDQFAGVISSVQPKLPFTIECEDYMWLLKQMPTPAKQWAKQTLQEIVQSVLDLNATNKVIARYKNYIKITVSDFSSTDLKFNVGNLITTNGSLATFLARIKSEYKVDSYLRGQELRIGLLHYLPQDTVQHVFTFQKNILDNDKLKWQRKDDIVLSMIVKSHYTKESATGAMTKDGQIKTVQTSTEILIYNVGGVNGTFTYTTKEKGQDFPTKYLNDIGERFTFNVYDNITDPVKLFNLGVTQLQKYYYNGFKGSFTTFGIPYVKHGDTVQLINNALPEIGTIDNTNKGLYKVKGVRYYGGFDDGLRQEISIDYRIDEN